MRAKTYTSKVQGTSKVQIRYKVKKQQGMYRRVCVGVWGVRKRAVIALIEGMDESQDLCK